MKKILSIILLITSLFVLSCNNNSTSPFTVSLGITVNPYGVTPLSAIYVKTSVNTAPVTVKVKGLYGEPDIIYTYPAGYGTEFEIHGMFPESDNVIEVNDGISIITKNVTVGSLSYNGTTIQKKYDVAINNLPEEKYKNNPELYFILNNSTPFLMAVSRNGYVRYLQTDYRAAKLVIENKKMVLYPAYNPSYNSRKNTDLLGRLLIRYTEGTHHDAVKMNNNYIYLSQSSFGNEDLLVEMNSSGNTIKKLNFGTLIENALNLEQYPNDEAVFKQIVFGEYVNNIYMQNNSKINIDWFHGNSLVYDSDTDILYVSSRHRGVLAIDYSEWKLIWWMADETLSTEVKASYGGIPYDVHFKDLESLEPYRVKGDALNDGPKNQHALFLLENGNLGMFDNQGDEYDNNPNGSRYVEYEITGTYGNYTAQKVYEYRDSSLYSRTMSDADFTGESFQNLLLLYSDPNARILEIEKDTENVLFRLDLGFSPYRIDKMPLYYDEGRVYSEDCNLKNPN